jgi:hypothetical protein
MKAMEDTSDFLVGLLPRYSALVLRVCVVKAGLIRRVVCVRDFPVADTELIAASTHTLDYCVINL